MSSRTTMSSWPVQAAQWSAFLCLSPDPASIGLADAFSLSGGALAGLLALAFLLLSALLLLATTGRGAPISRNRSSADRRSARLSLTGQGEELLDRIEASRALGPESLGDPLDVLASEERAEFRRALDKISRRARDIL